MIYIHYQDDGPKGIAVQVASVTAPWSKLVICHDYSTAKQCIDKILSNRNRSKPRIAGIFSDDEADGLSEVLSYK